MNVVGRVGSLISQGVYSVATPFHPFGGAVDVIAVRQEDGTYRSTPWYVRFGKFQGVLKGAEKIVTITVNGVEANFHMYLDNSGQAYFMRELTPGISDAESSEQARNELHTPERTQSENIVYSSDGHQSIYDESKGEVENGEQSYRFPDEQASSVGSPGSSGYGNYHYGSLDEVEDMVKDSNESNSEMVLISVDGHVLTAPISSIEENTDNVRWSTPQFHLGPGEGSSEDFGANGDVWGAGLFHDLNAHVPKDAETSVSQMEGPRGHGVVSVSDAETHCAGGGYIDSEDVGAGLSKNDTFQSCLDLSNIEDSDLHDVLGSPSTDYDHKTESECSPKISSFTTEEMTANTDQNVRGDDALEPVNFDMKDLKGNGTIDLKQKDDDLGAGEIIQSSDKPRCQSSPANDIEPMASEGDTSHAENLVHEGSGSVSVRSSIDDKEHLGTPSERPAAEEHHQSEVRGLQRRISGLGFDISLCGNVLRPGMGRNSAEQAFEAHCISEEEFKESGLSIIKNVNLIVRFEGKYFRWDKVAHLILGKAVFGSHFSIEPNDAIRVEHEETARSRAVIQGDSPSISRRWRLWPIPFRRSKSLQHSNSNTSSEELFVDSESGLQSPNAEQSLHSNSNPSPRKQFVRTNIPTNEQIASLNLKEGQNMIAFSFSTRVLGKQQVDAHIYLWKWNARIVISDVDGTITKSDVLGQFMPLVGKDWTQSGVARLFSAIKENGYQLLFLSARAIVQAYLTRSFLLNLKQDGKALPSGPVVISPDGLFPSLFREVIRRAPHEFKIACLEDIRALFPSDYNPFYAGFGNRDTDELSYKKIGIPKGKIFIINPKGEVAINNCVDVKSYTSLHTLVNDMFPPTSLVEQEDFNSWNYWKMPLPDID